MKISIFGMGYVGVVSAGCLARDGHYVIGVDTVQGKVRLINEGRSPIIEKGCDEIIRDAVCQGLLRATTEVEWAIEGSDISLVCVGTPSLSNGSLNLQYVRRVCEGIGAALKRKNKRHIIVVRSTVLPGTMRNVIIPALEEFSGKTTGEDFGLCMNPEFLREGTAISDFYDPPKIVIGETETLSGDHVASLYEKMDAPLIRTDLETAEMVKYVDNVWHALKVGFGNEIGNICKKLGIDGHQVMDIFCKDTKLNISRAYLKPGFAFGGSCLPKDLRALLHKTSRLDLNLPILNAILPSNDLQIAKGLQLVMQKGNRNIGVLGFSFKPGTDDLRESPVVELIERLIGKGYDLRLYDREVNLAKLIGSNRDYILNHIPHIARIMVPSIQDVMDHAETVVVGNADHEFKTVLNYIRPGQVIVDLVRIFDNHNLDGNYEGICW